MSGQFEKLISIRCHIRCVAIFMFVLTGVACSSDAEKAGNAFQASCEAAGGTKSACKCSFTVLQEKYGDEVVVKIVGGEVPPNFMQTMQEAGNQCRFK